jgi:hypothetical protein
VKRIAFVAVASAVALVGFAVPAVADHGQIDDQPLVRGEWIHYNFDRHITLDESHIFVKKTDGPRMGIRWRNCDGTGHGPEVILRNEDPTERRAIGVSLNAPKCFKLDVKSYGELTVDTWSGEIWWNTRS